MTFGERLKGLRNKAKLSFAALAEATGLGASTLKDYEAGRRSPLLENAQTIARALGVSCEAFDGCVFGRAEQKPKAKRKGK